MLNGGPLNNSPLNDVGDTTLVKVYSSTSIGASYDILNIGTNGGEVYSPTVLGNRRLYIGAPSKKAAVAHNMFEVIKVALINSGFNVVQGLKTTDIEYKYLDITVAGMSGVDVPKHALIMSSDTNSEYLPYLVSYYGSDFSSSASYCGNPYVDTVVPDTNFWALQPNNPFLQGNDVELTVMTDAIQGIWWFCITHIVGTKKLIQKFQMATYSNRVPEDQSTPEQSSTRYGVFELVPMFNTCYGVSLSFDSGAVLPWDNNYGAGYSVMSLLEGMSTFTTPQQGLSTTLSGAVIPYPTSFTWPSGYQINAPCILGALQGVRMVLFTDSVPAWSTFTDKTGSYVTVQDDMWIHAANGNSVDHFAVFVNEPITQLPDFN